MVRGQSHRIPGIHCGRNRICIWGQIHRPFLCNEGKFTLKVNTRNSRGESRATDKEDKDGKFSRNFAVSINPRKLKSAK